MSYKDPERQRAYMREWKDRRRREWLAENGPCVECGSWNQLEVDHIDPSQKIDHKVWTWSQFRREAELAKCQVLCHECHAEKTGTAHVVGEQVGTSVMTADAVRMARRLREAGNSYRVIGETLGFKPDTIRWNVTRGGWKHLGDDPTGKEPVSKTGMG